MARSKAQNILNDLESSNHFDILGNLYDDELVRLKNILFVWYNLSCHEIDRRRAERGRTMERIVRVWADYILYFYAGKRYCLLLYTGDPVGPEIIAEDDEEAILKAADIVKEKDKR